MGKLQHKARAYEKASILHKLLQDNKRISLDRIAEELGVCQRTARRWVYAVSLTTDIRLERGIVIVGEG